MKITNIVFVTVMCFWATSAYAGGWSDFAKGFAETTAATQERRKCEQTYSPSMCTQMKADKEQKEAQERRNRETEAELRRQREEINHLKQQQQQLQNQQYRQ
ncbi:MAG: hypothetical protein AB7L92_02595 [Alphaproteobacteria bacterium]